MHVTPEDLDAAVCAQMCANPHATRIVVSPRVLRQLQQMHWWAFAAIGHKPCGETVGRLFGLPLVLEATGTCRNCGAPLEPVACSYCRSPSDFIEVR